MTETRANAKTPEVAFNRYYTYQELTDILQGIAKAYPTLVDITPMGQSYQGRDVWMLTITNKETGPDSEKPAIYVEGNIHAGEVTASMTALYLIDHLTSRYGKDDAVTRLVDTRAFYIAPRVNPDGAEKYLTTPFSLRSSVRPYPDEDVAELPGLHAEDINGDGWILQMRVRDDRRGEWKPSLKDERAMIPRLPGEVGGPFYRIYSEGLIKDYQGEPFDVQPSRWGLDMNRNFPSNWDPELAGGGPYPTSEPEVRNVVEFIVNHPNIGAIQSLHTSGGFFFRNPYQYSDDEMDQMDLAATKAIAREGQRVTGYKDVKSSNRSTLPEWAYEHYGIIGFTTELWSVLGRAGIEMEKFWDAEDPEEKEDMLIKLLDWNDKELAGSGFFNWTSFDHPQLGEVELGGWNPKYFFQNPPPSFLEQECHKNAHWLMKHAAALPLAVIGEVEAEAVGGDVYRVRALGENLGYLSTATTNKALEVKVVKPDRVRLVLPEDGVELVSGEREVEVGNLDGYHQGQQGRWSKVPAKSSARVQWVVKRGADAAEVEVELWTQRAGSDRRKVTLK